MKRILTLPLIVLMIFTLCACSLPSDISKVFSAAPQHTKEPSPSPVPTPIPTTAPTPSPVPVPIPTSIVVTPVPITKPSPKPTSVVPAVTPTQEPAIIVVDPKIQITKNPTNEYHKEGETAWFCANANIADSINWTFVSPDGGEYSVQNFENKFIQCDVSGEYGYNLCIQNVSAAMNGWGAYCTIIRNNEIARTAAAYLFVESAPEPTYPPDTPYDPVDNDSCRGCIIDVGMSSVTIDIFTGSQIQVLKDVITPQGADLYFGRECTVYFHGVDPLNVSQIYSVVLD